MKPSLNSPLTKRLLSLDGTNLFNCEMKDYENPNDPRYLKNLRRRMAEALKREKRKAETLAAVEEMERNLPQVFIPKFDLTPTE